MQKLTKKLIAFLACMMLILSMALAATAADDGDVVRKDGFSSMKGLEISVSTDSDKYKSGEAVEYTMSFKNTNDYDLDKLVSFAVSIRTDCASLLGHINLILSH